MSKFKLATLLVLLVAANSSVVAQWDGVSSVPFSHGSGTENDPYLIEEPSHLAYVSDMVASGVTDYEGQYIKLTADISLSNKQWQPIGDRMHPFRGNFDGGGHMIDSIYHMLVISQTGSNPYLGLFGYISDAFVEGVIANVYLWQKYTGTGTHLYSNGQDKVGGVAGYAVNSIIRKSETYGFIRSDWDVNSNNSAKQFMGGVVGHAENTIFMYNINHCRVIGHQYTGGITGKADTCTIFKCYNDGSIEGNLETIIHSCNQYLGGIAGYAGNQSYIMQCGNTGNITCSTFLKGDNSEASIAGITVRAVEISHCYNRGTLRVTPYNASTYHGTRARLYGIGFAVDTVKNCYNVGEIATLDNAYRYAINKYHPRHQNNYYLNTFTGSTDQTGTPRTDEQMKSAVFVTMLNGGGDAVFEQDIYNENGGYPVFANGIRDAYRLSVRSADESMGSVRVLQEPTAADPQAIVVAIPSAGYSFSHWSDGSTDNPYSFTLTDDTQLIAYFSAQGGGDNPSGIDNVLMNGISLSAEDCTIKVTMDSPRKVSVYTIEGRLIAAAYGTCSMAVPIKGVYVVLIDNLPIKIFVE